MFVHNAYQVTNITAKKLLTDGAAIIAMVAGPTISPA